MEPMTSRFIANMRADLAGGTLDIWPLYLALENCKTVQFSIPFYIQVHLTLLDDSSITVHFQNDTFSAQNLEDFLSLSDSKLRLIQAIFRFIHPSKGMKLQVFSDSPLGGGLGASSCFCVCLLRCLEKAFSLKIPDILLLCRDLEAKALRASAGWQDYIIPLQTVSQIQKSSIDIKDLDSSDIHSLEDLPLSFQSPKKNILSHPFINIIHFSPSSMKVETLKLPQEVIDQNLLFVDSSVSHQSEVNNSMMVQEAMKNPNSFAECRDIALEMASSCQNGNFHQWPLLFEKEYQFRKTLHSYVHPEIESIKSYLIKEGQAQAVKIMGAGGGGVLLVWTPNKSITKKACPKLRFLN